MSERDVTQEILRGWAELEGEAEPEQEETPAEEQEETPPEQEEPEPEEEETPDEEPEEEESEVVADYPFDNDAEIQAYLSKYDGDVAKALKSAADLQRVYARQGTELGNQRQRVAQLEAAMLEAQALAGGALPLTPEVQNWVEEAATSVNPGVYVRQALQEGQYEVARAVCREWARENPFEANRAGQFIDYAESQAHEASQAPSEYPNEAIVDALKDAMPEIRSWEPQMVAVIQNLGQAHPLVRDAKSTNPDTAMSGLIGIFEIARAANASVKDTRERLTKEARQEADEARAGASVSSATSSPKRAEPPRNQQLMPGLTLEDLDTEFART